MSGNSEGRRIGVSEISKKECCGLLARVRVYRNLCYKMSWNYYGFNETGNTNPFGLAAIQLRDFDGSNATFSFRYAF